MAPAKHQFRFARVGGVDQAVIGEAGDLANLDLLDDKLWAALAMPTRGLHFDARTLDLIDADKDGRIRARDIRAAVKWAVETFKDPKELFQATDVVQLDAIKDGPVLNGARRILQNLGKGGAKEISLADVSDTQKIFASTRFNGDGVVPADSAPDEKTKKAIEEIISATGAVPDRSGKPGVDKSHMQAFEESAKAFADWYARTEQEPALMPLGDATPAAMEAFAAVEPKIEDYFTRCRLLAFDPKAAEALNKERDELAKPAARLLAPTSEEVIKLPMAHPEPGRALPLGQGVNPAWAAPVAVFVQKTVTPLLGRKADALTEEDFGKLREKLAPYRAWQAAKPKPNGVDKLGHQHLRDLLSGVALKQIAQLIDEDNALAPETNQIEAVEKLIRLQRDLVKLLNNFVNFSEFYGRRKAIFQSGTLYLDGRACELCIEVTDAGKHATLGTMSGAFLAYCDCTRGGGQKTSIVAAFTDGSSDNLFAGRNGVYYDRDGNDWDATITRIVSNPISIREAFWSPYKKFVRLIEEQVAKRAGAAQAEADEKLTGAAAATVNVDKAAAARPAPKKIDVGTVAAIGVAVGGIGAMLTGFLASFLGLGVWMPLGIAAVLLLISGPSMILAYLKLRQRNLGPLLDANGWAVNGRARINVPFGAALTHLATLPAGSTRILTDPYAEKRRPWKTYLAIVIVLALGVTWYLGKLDGLLPNVARSTSVLGKYAPAAPPAAPTPPATPATPAPGT